MYFTHHVTVDQPAHAVRRELLDPAERWLPPSISSPLGGRRYLASVGFGAGAARVSKQVELVLGEPEQPGQWLVIKIAWRATGAGELFPTLDGKLTVKPLGPHSSDVSIGAAYQTPLGALGRELDHVALHTVANATIRDFVEGVAGRLSELAANRPA
jgi:hypothetical protein